MLIEESTPSSTASSAPGRTRPHRLAGSSLGGSHLHIGIPSAGFGRSPRCRPRSGGTEVILKNSGSCGKLPLRLARRRHQEGRRALQIKALRDALVRKGWIVGQTTLHRAEGAQHNEASWGSRGSVPGYFLPSTADPGIRVTSGSSARSACCHLRRTVLVSTCTASTNDGSDRPRAR